MKLKKGMPFDIHRGKKEQPGYMFDEDGLLFWWCSVADLPGMLFILDTTYLQH